MAFTLILKAWRLLGQVMPNVGLPQYTITLGEPIEKEVQKSSKGNAGYLFVHYKNHR
jgi:hypothetical protein